jgi:hypothetical protein
MPHRKLLEGTSGGKLAPLAISPDETPTTVSSDCSQNLTIRRPSVTTLVCLSNRFVQLVCGSFFVVFVWVLASLFFIAFILSC